MNRFFITICFAVILISTSPVFASETNGTIDSSYKFAWGENLGWVNMAPDNGGLTITDSAITGYAWTSAAGWLNFSAGGVTNTSEGVLGGYAWSSQKGWIDLTGVTINSSGLFTGTAGAQSSTTGRINFDCDNCEVRTDWRPLSVRGTDDADSGSSSSGGSSATTNPNDTGTVSPGESGGDIPPEFVGDQPVDLVTQTEDPVTDFYRNINEYEPSARGLDNYVESFGSPLIVEPEQTGLLVWDFSTPRQIENEEHVSVIVEVPQGAHESRIIVSASLLNPATVADYKDSTYILGGIIFDVTATDEEGNVIHDFDQPLQITLIVPESLQGREDLGVFWLDEESNEWIQVDGVTFDGSLAKFSVDHLTKFAVMVVEEKSDIASMSALVDSKPLIWLWLLLLIPIVWLVVRIRRNRKV